MTTKQKVERFCEANKVEIEIHTNPYDKREIFYVELIAPTHNNWDGDLHTIICTGWEDAFNQINWYQLASCPSNCDCRC